MSDNKENIKIKLSLDNLFPKTESKTDSSDIPPLSGTPDIPPVSKPASEPSSMENLEELGLKLKAPGAKLSGTGEKNIPVQDVKFKVKLAKSVSDSTDKKDVLPQPPKSNEQVPFPSNVSTEQEGAHPSLNKDNLKPEEPPVHQEGETNKAYFDHFEVVSTGNGDISDTVKLQLKPKTASSSAFSALTSEEKPQANIPAKENNGNRHDSSSSFTDVKPAKKNTRYLYLVVALIIMVILLYFLISTIKTLMTI